MLEPAFIRRKLSLNAQDLLRLAQFSELTFSDISHGEDVAAAACERYLERIITRAIDVNRHFLAELGDASLTPKSYRETFLRLADLSVYPKVFVERLAPSASFRNALVHEYNNLDPKLLAKSIPEAIQDFNEYAKFVLAFLAQKERIG